MGRYVTTASSHAHALAVLVIVNMVVVAAMSVVQAVKNVDIQEGEEIASLYRIM
jgi:hypothetical protein